jgi:hypothetical protein
MNIVISSGHGRYIRGASGYLDEVDEARLVVNTVADLLKAAGVGVKTFHDDVSKNQSDNLNRIVSYHNSQQRDLDVSVHFNAYQTTSKPMGTECLYVTQSKLADAVAEAISGSSGLIDRGPKKRTDLYFLNNTTKPSILIEVCFVDSQADANIYKDKFDAICQAIAESVSGQAITPLPPGPDPEPPEPFPPETKPMLRKGDEGSYVSELQGQLNDQLDGCDLTVDGDFGSGTDGAVRDYQRSRGLMVDGIVGQDTWDALDNETPALPPPPGALTADEQADIREIAKNSKIASYSWKDRSKAPTGWMQGMALAFAQSYRKLNADHPAMVKMSRAQTNSDKDALYLYRKDFEQMGMSNVSAGPDVLRHLYALMLGHGMRESSGKHCCGRDQSASNTDSNTCEAGAFQTSYNAAGSNKPEFDDLMDEYLAGMAQGYLDAFDEGVSCSSSDWASYGSGRGREFQDLCKNQPAFSAESCGLTLRNLCNHYGPIIRHESELKKDADVMLQEVQDYIDQSEPEVA